MDISFAKTIPALLKGSQVTLVVGPAAVFTKRRLPRLLDKRNHDLLLELAKDAKPGDQGATAGTLTGRVPRRLVLGVLPDTLSRYNSPSRAVAIRKVVAETEFGPKGKSSLLLLLDGPEQLLAAVNAVGRALPRFSAKSKEPAIRRLQLLAVDRQGHALHPDADVIETLEASRDAAELVDTPPGVLGPEEMARRAREMLVGIPGVKVKVIVGEALLKENLRAIHAVGRCAVQAPRMLVATCGKGDGPRVALVGKGVTYDTGGLHIKSRGYMEGMKCDMGGAAAVLGAFRVLAKAGCSHPLALVLCLAENAIGPEAFKPDDVISAHSGKTIEVNNTDAEGRLLLADGVSYAARELGADHILDAATLTGAQLIATGVLHAAVVANDEALERTVVEAGRHVGDLAHPLPFAPELFKKEFKSEVADMRNSVKNRMNAQTSCAAQFVYWHIEDAGAKWAHIDLAGPAFPEERGSGYGVALLSETVRRLGSPAQDR